MAEYHQKVALPLISDGTPMILANCFDDRGTPAILPDDWRGQHDLVARLITAGHRRIGYVTGPANRTTTCDRLTGHRLALGSAAPELLDQARHAGARTMLVELTAPAGVLKARIGAESRRDTGKLTDPVAGSVVRTARVTARLYCLQLEETDNEY